MFNFSGISSLAVALMHSYTFDEHELKVAEIAKSVGFKNVSLSSQIMPMVRLVPRGFTASVHNKHLPFLNVFSANNLKILCNLNPITKNNNLSLNTTSKFQTNRLP